MDDIIQQLKIYTLSSYNINFLTNELKKIYQSYGYNTIQITTTTEGLDNNSSNLYLNFDEGDITKIKRINIRFIEHENISTTKNKYRKY